MVRPSAALFRRAMAAQAPIGRPVPVVAALDAGAAVVATCPSARDAEELRRAIGGGRDHAS